MTPTITPSATLSPAPTHTPSPTPVFIAYYVFGLEEEILDAAFNITCCREVFVTEFTVEEGILTTDNISSFLQLSRAALGSYGGEVAVQILLDITNTTADPLALDFDERFFGMSDGRGWEAPLLAFCCAAHGEFLAPQQQRTLEILFQGMDDWYSKGSGINFLYFHIHGLRPITRATWELTFPAVAD